MPTEVVLKIRVDKNAAVADIKAFQASALAAFKGLQDKGLTGNSVAAGLGPTTTEVARTTRAVTASMDQQKAAQFRTRQLMLEDYKRYLTQEISAQAEHTRRAIALGDALLRAEKQQAAEGARARREATADENRQQRDESYVIRSQQQTGRAEERAGERQGGARARLTGEAGTGLMVGGGVILAGLAVATEQFSRFDAKMVEVRNNTQMTDAEFDAMKAHILQTGQATGASMEQMAEAFMRAKNHAFDLKDSLSIVDAATKSALATGSDIGETANVLSQTMHIFRLNGDQAAEAMNTLHMASLQGNTTMSELVQNFGLAEAVTSKYGLTLADTSAVFATMTENGLNAAEAGTQIRDVMQHLVAPGKAAREEIARLSKTFPEFGADIEALKNGTGSLTKTMIDLSAATGGQAREINKIIPAQRGAFGAMALSGKAADDLKRNYDQLVLTMAGKLDPTTDGFLRQQKTLSAQTARLNIDVQAVENTIGKALTPTVRDAADALGSMARGFNALSPETQRAIVLGTALVGILALVGGGALSAATKIASLMADLRTAGIAFGGVEAAATAAGTAETGMAAEGVTAFAAGGPWGLAIAAAALLIGGIALAWDKAQKAQDDYAAKKLKDASSTSTPDVRTNITNQLQITTEEIARQQSLLNQLKANPKSVMQNRNPGMGIVADRVVPMDKLLQSGVPQIAIDKRRKDQIAEMTHNIAAMQAANAALHSDTDATTNLGIGKRNFLKMVNDASASQGQIMSRVQEIDKLTAKPKMLSQSPGQYKADQDRWHAERAAQMKNYNALQTDKEHNQKSADYMEALEGKELKDHGGVGVGMATGMAIAEAAYKQQLDGSARTFVHQCEGLAHATYSKVTSAYSQVLDHSGGSAKSAAEKFLKMGLAKPYTPGMDLAPGSLLYSTTMGRNQKTGEIDGHVQTIGPQGQRLDQYGTNHFAEKNFQYYVPPPGGKVGDKDNNATAPVKKTGNAGDAGESDKAAADQAQALVEAAGLDVDKASTAFDHCKNEYARTGDDHFLVLAKIARMKLRQAQMSRAQAALAKEVSAAHKDGTNALAAKEEFKSAKFSADNSYTTDIQGLGDQMSGTPKDKVNTAFDVAIGRKESQLAAARSQIEHYSRALDKGNDPQVADALANAYGREKTLTDQKAGIEYKKGTFNNRSDDGVLKQKEMLTVAEAQRTLDQNLLALAEKRQEAFTRILDAQKQQRQESRRLIDVQLAAPGVTDAQKTDLRAKKYGLDIADIGGEYTRDQASLSKPARDNAKPKFDAALRALNTEYTSGTTENANEALRRHADLLHTQADATDDLNQKMLLLTQYFETLTQVAGQTPEQKAALGIDRKTTLGDLQRGITSRDGQLQIGTGLQNKDQSQVGLGLQILGINATTGTKTQQAAGRGEYLDTVKGLGMSGALPADEALLRVQGIRNAAQTPAEIAAATDAARQILDRMLTEKGRDIALINDPEERRRAIQTEITQVQKNPDVPAEVKHDAVAGLTGQLDSGRGRDKQSIGGEEFWESMAADAGNESGNIIRALLNPKDKKNIGKQFWSWLSQTGENALGSVVSSSIQNALTGGLKGMNGKNLFGDVEGLFKGAKGSMLEGAAGIYGAAMALGAGGKKKQTHSIFGAVLGGIAGSFFGQAGTGAEVGSALGGMFAEGGRPPVGRISIIGEKGRELFVPDSPGTIIPNHGIAAFTQQAMTPQARMPSFAPAAGTRSASAPQGASSSQTGGDMDASITINQSGDHHSHTPMDIQAGNVHLARTLERARRGGVPTS